MFSIIVYQLYVWIALLLGMKIKKVINFVIYRPYANGYCVCVRLCDNFSDYHMKDYLIHGGSEIAKGRFVVTDGLGPNSPNLCIRIWHEKLVANPDSKAISFKKLFSLGYTQQINFSLACLNNEDNFDSQWLVCLISSTDGKLKVDEIMFFFPKHCPIVGTRNKSIPGLNQVHSSPVEFANSNISGNIIIDMGKSNNLAKEENVTGNKTTVNTRAMMDCPVGAGEVTYNNNTDIPDSTSTLDEEKSSDEHDD